MDDSWQVLAGVTKLSHDVVGLLGFSKLSVQILATLTLSHPSKAHSPAYIATAQELALVLVPSNHPRFFQSSFAVPDVEKPVTATTMPTTVTPSNATNLKNMNMSPILVPSLVDIQFNKVTK